MRHVEIVNTVINTVYTRYLYDVYRRSIDCLTSISDAQFAQQMSLLKANGCNRIHSHRYQLCVCMCKRAKSRMQFAYIYTCTRTVGTDGSGCCAVVFPYDRKLNFMSTCVAYNQREFVRIGGTCICYNHYFGPQKRILGKRVYVGETGEIM